MRLVDIWNEGVFFIFNILLIDDGIDMDFFDIVDGFNYCLFKYWCFFVEIVDVGIFLCLRFEVKD